MNDREEKKNRRELFGSGALAVAGTLLAGLAVACGDDEEDKPGTGDGGKEDGGTAGDGASPDAGTVDADVAVLNTLLGAEYKAIAAYTAAGPAVTAASASDPLYPLREVIVAVATNIVGQHQLHAAALVEAINALGGTPVAQSSVTFSLPKEVMDNPTITNILKLATRAERDAAVSYNVAVAGLEAAKHRYLATAIEGDESQHFIILAALVAGLADPGPKLALGTANQLPPKAFVRKVGTQDGLESLPRYYPLG
jgi:bacterioferritin (cytochrome b1)